MRSRGHQLAAQRRRMAALRRLRKSDRMAVVFRRLGWIEAAARAEDLYDAGFMLHRRGSGR